MAKQKKAVVMLGKTVKAGLVQPILKPVQPDLALSPGIRDRMFVQMNESGIPEERRLRYLCAITGCAPQTVRRWITSDKPGLPDLSSFATICLRFNTDANWFLGLTSTKYQLSHDKDIEPKLHSPPLARDDTEWIDYITHQAAERAGDCIVLYMPGDEMEPRIQEGAPLLVKSSIQKIEGNGIYVLIHQGRTLVRTIEHRIGEGIVIGCINKSYKDVVLKDEAAAKKFGVSVIGKVEYWVQLMSPPNIGPGLNN